MAALLPRLPSLKLPPARWASLDRALRQWLAWHPLGHWQHFHPVRYDGAHLPKHFAGEHRDLQGALEDLAPRFGFETHTILLGDQQTGTSGQDYYISLGETLPDTPSATVLSLAGELVNLQRLSRLDQLAVPLRENETVLVGLMMHGFGPWLLEEELHGGQWFFATPELLVLLHIAQTKLCGWSQEETVAQLDPAYRVTLSTLLAEWDKVLAADPKLKARWAQRSEWLRALHSTDEFVRQGMTSLAITALQPYQGWYESEPLIAYEAGLLLLRAGEHEGATKRFEQVLAADPHHAMAVFQLARLAAREGDRTACKTWTDRLSDLEPEHPGRYLALAEAEAFHAFWPATERWAAEALERFEPLADAHDLRAKALTHLGKTAAAKRHRTRARELREQEVFWSDGEV